MGNVDIAVFPGSFDPLTNGHVDIVERALAIFDKLIIGVLENPQKRALFSLSEREAFFKDCFKNQQDRIEVKSFSGLLVDFAKEHKSRVVVRGLRAISDFDYEAQMALMNRKLDKDIETFFLMTSAQHSYISSSLVKQVAPLSGDVSGLVPPIVEEALRQKFKA